MEKTIKANKKCPKCRSSRIIIIELWKGHSIDWEQENGEIIYKEGNLNPGDPYRVECLCKDCRHIWQVKGAVQITDLEK